MSDVTRSLPRPTDNTRPFWEAARDHRLVIQQCKACGQRQFYPRNICTECGQDDLAWVDCSGRGTVYTFTINHRGPDAYWRTRTPYVVALIELEEGVRMMANILGEHAPKIRIGSPVKVVFEDIGGVADTEERVSLPQFVPC